MEKYLSIITNFGCHFKCPYCITKKNGINIPKTTVTGLCELENKFNYHHCNIISVSGGGDPLFEYQNHKKWYDCLFDICEKRNIPLEMHTSYLTEQTEFPFDKCKRVVYHLNDINDMSKIKRIGSEIIRVVFVVTKEYTVQDIMDIACFVNNSNVIDELSFRQLVDENYKIMYYLDKYLKLGHKKLWHYIEQNDYNLYYVEGKVYNRFSDFQNKGLIK